MDSNKKRQRKWKLMIYIPFLLCLFLFIWKLGCEPKNHWIPDYAKEDLSPIIQKKIISTEEFTEAEYGILRAQTGLGKTGVDQIIQSEGYEQLFKMQERLFEEVEIKCKKNSPISWEEKLDVTNSSLPILVPLEDGDILYTPNSHTFGWRNGHSAIVVNSQNGETLESVVLGQDSAIQSVEKWRHYPAFMVLRLKNTDREKRKQIAQNALQLFTKVPYGFTGDLQDSYQNMKETKNTHCAHLVWKAYAVEGFDLDSDGGIIVTPKDIADSPLLEVVQSYGILFVDF